jgi:hemolysin activation/secretion protein
MNKLPLLQRIILAILLVLLSMQLSHAQLTDQQAVDQLEKTQRRQQSIPNQGQEFFRDRKPTTLDIPKPSFPEKADSTTCLKIKAISASGHTVLPQSEVTRIIMPINSKSCITLADINEVMRDITNAYMDNGYVTSRVAIPNEAMKEGVFTLKIIEGRIESITLNENTRKDRWQVATAMPGIIGKILNLRDIEQGVDQINRLASNQATIELEPGSAPGLSKVIITNKPLFNGSLSVGINNSGQTNIGRNKAQISLSYDNAIGINDTWYLQTSESLVDDTNEKKSRAYYGSMSIPYGYWLLSATHSLSDYAITSNQLTVPILSSGTTKVTTGAIDRVIYRNQDSKISLNSGFTYKDINNLNNGIELATNTRHIAIAEIGASIMTRAFDTIWSSSFTFSRGLDAFGAKKDPDDIADDQQKAQFDRYNMTASAYHPFEALGQDFIYQLTISGQYSPDRLFPSERINIGDRYTVVGFQEDSLLGDSGGYLRNDIALNLSSAELTGYDKLYKYLGNIQPYIALDGGYARKQGGKNGPESTRGAGYLSGAAIGLRNQSGLISFDIAHSTALKSPEFIQKRGNETYATISLKWQF